MLNALRWLGEEAARRGVEIQLNQVVDLDYVREIKPDQVVLATGAVVPEARKSIIWLVLNSD